MKTSSTTIQLTHNDWGNSRELVIIHSEIPKAYSFSDLKEAVERINKSWIDHHYIEKYYGTHDCDGSLYTQFHTVLSKKIVNDNMVEYIIEHEIQANI